MIPFHSDGGQRSAEMKSSTILLHTRPDIVQQDPLFSSSSAVQRYRMPGDLSSCHT